MTGSLGTHPTGLDGKQGEFVGACGMSGKPSLLFRPAKGLGIVNHPVRARLLLLCLPGSWETARYLPAIFLNVRFIPNTSNNNTSAAAQAC